MPRTRCSPRITASPSPSRSELDAYLQMMEEAKKRDHRKLGKELGLFDASAKRAPASPFFLPNGMVLYATRWIELLA